MTNKWLNNLSIAAGIGALGLCSLAFARPAENSGANANLTAADRTFVESMARGNVAEIELGKLAEQKGSNQAVKDFGQRMVRDHTELNNELKQFAQTKNVTLPTTLSSADMAQKQKMEQLSGTAFDKAYMMDMLSDHQHDIQEVQQKAENAQDPGVKHLAEKALPILEDHLRIAENDAGQVGISSAKGLNEPEHPNGR